MSDRALLLSINEITALKNVQKEIVIKVAVPKNNSKKVKSTPKGQPFGESNFRKSELQVQLFTTALLKYLLFFMNNCNYCCEIVKLTESNCSKSHLCKWKCLQLPF